MRKRITAFSILFLLLAVVFEVNAQSISKPNFMYQKYKDYGIVTRLSDNGKWALVTGASTEQKTSGYVHLVNVATGEENILCQGNETQADVMGKYEGCDVTDDGNIIVGAFGGEFTMDGYYTGKPGYWNKSTKKWTALPMPKGATVAVATSVTPDGRYALGTSETDVTDWMSSVSEGVMWDLTTGKIVDLPGRPVMEMDKTPSGKPYAQQESFTGMSADGRYIVVYGNQSYTPINYVYDREKGTYFQFGKQGTNAPSDFLQMEPNGAMISSNGKWVAGTIRTVNDNVYPLLYNMETGEYTYYNSKEEDDLGVDIVTNDGELIASSPTTSPIRQWQFITGNVWYPFEQIMQQRYGLSYSDYTGFTNTGSVFGLSNDGKTVAVMVSPQGESYIATLPEALNTSCQNIDLFKDYTVEPSEGAEYHWMESLTLTFSNDIVVLGDKKSAVLKDKNGKTIRSSIAFHKNPTHNRVLEITFRATEMNSGEDYTVEIPAGKIGLAKNSSKTNGNITLHFKGRDDVPVKLCEAFPVDNAEIARIDNTGNPVYLTFDTKVKVSKDAAASLVQIDDVEEKTICKMSVVTSFDNSKVALVPAATQYLYSGAKYKVVLAKGSLIDMSGSEETGNEEIVLNYIGSYERQISTDDADLFFDDFSSPGASLKNFMRYEGDHNTPTNEMQRLGFDADNQPWNFSIRESNESQKYYACSTSMYSPAGISDDWLIIPQLQIPDAFTTLSFKAQSYLEGKKDVLKVVVWPQEENINYFNSTNINEMKTKGDVTEYELNIGDTEEGLEGEFTEYKLSLAKYAGKKVYIAFWNNNNDQSCIFLDNVLVRRNLKYLMSLNNAQSVVDKENIKMSGSLVINSDDDTFRNVSLTLKDGEGKVIDTFSKTGLSLKKGDKCAFAFEKPLPLTVGEINKYTIGVKLDDYTDEQKGTIKNLTFEPTKRVVLEENTGFTCQFCPLGILALERLTALYGEQFIPLCLHTYTGDPYGSGLTGYSQYLGLNVAPSAIIQRNGIVSSPMEQDDEGDYQFNYEGKLWCDIVAKEMNVPADLEVSVPSIIHNEATNKLDISIAVKSALNLKNQYINMFAVALEDNIVSTQENGLYNVSDPNLGEWGKGGKYAYRQVPQVSENNVVRSYWGNFAGDNVGFPQSFNVGETYSVDMSLTYPDQVYEKENGKIVFMLFDGNTSSLINAVMVKMADIKTNGICDIENTDINIQVAEGKVMARAMGNTTLRIYTLAGVMLGQASGTDNVNVSVAGYYGPAIVKASNGSSSVVRKVIIK